MLLFLIMWFVSSIIISVLLAQIIGRAPKINFYNQNFIENDFGITKNTDILKTYWYINEGPPGDKLELVNRIMNNEMLRIDLN